jgi:hypothetical protein
VIGKLMENWRVPDHLRTGQTPNGHQGSPQRHVEGQRSSDR